MYNVISAISTPLIVINAAYNYISWTHVDADDNIQRIFSQIMTQNLVAAGVVFCLGAAAVYNEEKNNTKADPVLSNMAGRLATIFTLAVAIGLSGASVNHWCYGTK